MPKDIRGIEYNPFLPSVECPDGAVFQIVVVVKNDDGEDVESCDMQASATTAAEYIGLAGE